MPTPRKPKIEYTWTPVRRRGFTANHKVNWRLVGANGEIMCQSNQGFRDKADAQRSVQAVAAALQGGDPLPYREVGPGRKPTTPIF